MISARSTNAESNAIMVQFRDDCFDKKCQPTYGLGQIASGHHENVLLVLELVELCQKGIDHLGKVRV